MKGGIGYGGPCLVRDSVALAALAKSTGGRALLAEATDQANQKEVGRLADLIKSNRTRDGIVGILGLSYKPGTDVVDSSQGVLLSQALAAEGISVFAYDPAAMDQAKYILGESIGFSESAEACIKQSDVIVITTPWKEFGSLNPSAFEPSGSRKLIDCWRILEDSQIADITEYIPLGVGPTNAA